MRYRSGEGIETESEPAITGGGSAGRIVEVTDVPITAVDDAAFDVYFGGVISWATAPFMDCHIEYGLVDAVAYPSSFGHPDETIELF